MVEIIESRLGEVWAGDDLVTKYGEYIFYLSSLMAVALIFLFFSLFAFTCF